MKTKVGDTVVIYLSGHGMNRDGQYYFCPTDEALQDPEKYALRYEDIEGLFDGIPARSRLILLDSCFSGIAPAPPLNRNAPGSPKGASFSLDPTGTPEDAQNVVLREHFNDLIRGTGALVIAASGSRETAKETKEGSFFSRALEGALGDPKTDSDGDGLISVSELNRAIGRLVAEISGNGQRPEMRRDVFGFDFPVGRVGH